MPNYAISRVINATPDRIWPVLTDPARLSDGTFGILKIDGKIAEAETIRLWSEVDPTRAFSIRVSDVVPERGMVWSSGMPLGLFTGRRRFRLTPAGPATEFVMREDYTGPLAAMMFRMIPDLQPSFEAFAAGLASACKKEMA